ncbi:MAG: SRPBCC family protein [Dehalococcoidia bacterium]
MIPHFNLTAEPGRQDVSITNVFDAPRDLVFRAYTDPKLIPVWWNSKDFAVEVEKMEVRPGGSWRVISRDASGGEYWFRGMYHDVSPPKRIVQTFEHQGMPGHISLETVTIEGLGAGRTRVTDHVVFQSVEDRDAALEMGMEAEAPRVMSRLEDLFRHLRGELSRAA